MAIVAGQILHAADINALTGLSARLDADSTPVISSTVFVNSALVIALAANTVYALDCFIIYDTAAAADLKWNITLPASSTMTFSNWGSDSTGAAFNSPIAHDVVTGATGSNWGGIASGSLVSAKLTATVRTSATAGNMTFQYAQLVSTASNTFLKRDSFIRCIPI
jgi:hypothetical protein